jgi:ATP-dependent helicase/nuclease subunit B
VANVFTIPPGAPFAQTLADELIRQVGARDDPLALARATIYVPTRRAVRSLGEIFARSVGGAALLPDIRPLGDVDEDDLLFDAVSEDVELLPAISTVRRRLLLATLIVRWQRNRDGSTMGFAQASRLARSLGAFLDEVQTQGAALKDLDKLAPTALSQYWEDVRSFLLLLGDEWPPLLAAENRQDHVVHRDTALRTLAQRLKAKPPEGPVIAAGSTGSIPATAELLDVISNLPMGAVVLPGLDLSLDEASWNGIDPGHPQFGMRQLLESIGVARDAVKVWGGGDRAATPREVVLRETLRPAPTTDAWRALADSGTEVIEKGLEGLSLVDAADPAQEATIIALMLREVLESEGQTGALVTPDRDLARRVAAELGRWNIAIDDSAGRPLARTAPGTFLCLLADAVQQAFAPVALLALLKHPLASGGEDTAGFRQMVRRLDQCLRGPRPDAGIDGIRQAVSRAECFDETARGELLRWLEGVANKFDAFAKALSTEEPLAHLLSLHVDAAEALAATDTETGGSRLWRGDAGRAAQTLVADLFAEADGLPAIDSASYASLFRTLAEEKAVRPAFGRHPRLAILGPLEARLQRFDLVVLGGLNEGSWPREAPVDPWLSRPMRKALGLEQPERAIGLSAHDFATLAAGPRVVLTRSRKVEGSPAVASRWLQRLIQLTRGLKLEERLSPPCDYCAIASALSEPRQTPRMQRPAPTPPVAARPRRLSVTEIETWLRDPYAIYAKHILKLKPLDPLDAEIGVLERGTNIHKALEMFVRAFPDGPTEDAERHFAEIADRVFAQNNIPKSVLAIWRPRFIRAASWFVDIERSRRMDIVRAHVELRGEMKFASPGGEFCLYGRADRIDELRYGNAAVIDYKTGAPPSEKQVIQIIAPQLPLEAAMLAEGGFPDAGKLAPTELIYVRFAGGAKPGELKAIKADAHELAVRAKELLVARVAQFDSAEQPYLPRVMPFRQEFSGDYDHLARAREWSASGWGEDE